MVHHDNGEVWSGVEGRKRKLTVGTRRSAVAGEGAVRARDRVVVGPACSASGSGAWRAEAKLGRPSEGICGLPAGREGSAQDKPARCVSLGSGKKKRAAMEEGRGTVG